MSPASVASVKFDSDHQAEAPDFLNRGMRLRERVETIDEIAPHLRDMREESVALDRIDNGDSRSTGERVAAECRSVHSGMEGFRGLFGAEHRAHGHSACDGFGERRDIRKDVVVLVGEPLAGAADTALDFVEYE